MSANTEASLRCQLMGGRLCVIHSNRIYDLTDFADRHPGGRQLIVEHVGKDVTELMKQAAIHKHSQAAYNILERHYIGEYHSLNSKEQTTKNGHTNGYRNGHKKQHTNGTSTNGTSTNGTLTKATTTNGTSTISKKGLPQYDDLLDWSRPIFWQVGSLGKKYNEWVHSPIDSSLWLFENAFVEYFSKAYWWTVLVYWVPILTYLVCNAWGQFVEKPYMWSVLGLGETQVPVVMFPVLFFTGFLLWTLDEYVLHRWLFHRKPPTNSKFLITLHFLFHGQHHKSPMDRNRLVFPIVPGTLMAFLIWNVYLLFFPVLITQILMAGTILGYLCYDLTHYYLHHGSPSLTYFKDLKTYHVKHHFKEQNQGFGISSKLWDYPFGTLIR